MNKKYFMLCFVFAVITYLLGLSTGWSLSKSSYHMEFQIPEDPNQSNTIVFVDDTGGSVIKCVLPPAFKGSHIEVYDVTIYEGKGTKDIKQTVNEKEMSIMYAYEWPECFETGIVNKPESERDKLLLAVDALIAWGNCHAGNKPPKCFGEIMVKIEEYLGIQALPDELTKYVDEHNK